MSDRVDDLVHQLAAAPTDRSLVGLEADIERVIQRRRSEVRTASLIAPVRIASIGLALAMGIAAGGVTAATAMAGPRPSGMLSGDADLAPSSLLEGRR